MKTGFSRSMARGLVCSALVLFVGGNLSFAHTLASESKKTSANAKAWVKLPQKHNGSGVGLRYRFTQAEQGHTWSIGQTVSIQIEFSGVQNAASSQIKHADGLKPVGNESLVSYKSNERAYKVALKKGSQLKTINFIAQSNGLHYVHIHTEQEGKFSVSAIPIRVGTDPIVLPTNGQVQTTPSGEKIVVMPAK